MNPAHIHLLLNTVPPIATIVALFVLGGALIARNRDARKVALLILVGAAVVAIPVYLTGKSAVMVVRDRAGLSLLSVGDHHAAAIAAMTALQGAALTALCGLVAFRRRMLPTWYAAVVMTLGIVAAILLIRTAHIGGHISHPETRRDFTYRR